MMRETTNSTLKTTETIEKKTWTRPAIIQIEVRKIRQEEVEMYYRMIDDPELFKLLGESGPT